MHLSRRRLTDSTAQQWFSEEKDQHLKDVRQIYFRTIKDGPMLWGSFDFQNASGETVAMPITLENGSEIDLGDILKDGFNDQDYAGVCQPIGLGFPIPCINFDPSKYDSIWLGDSQVTTPQPDYDIGVDFSDTPEYGVITEQ